MKKRSRKSCLKRNHIIIGIVALLVLIAILTAAMLSGRPSYCTEPNTVAVFSCSDGSYMVVSGLLGGGYRIVKPDGSQVSCPVIADPGEECMRALEMCSDVDLC